MDENHPLIRQRVFKQAAENTEVCMKRAGELATSSCAVPTKKRKISSRDACCAVFSLIACVFLFILGLLFFRQPQFIPEVHVENSSAVGVQLWLAAGIYAGFFAVSVLYCMDQGSFELTENGLQQELITRDEMNGVTSAGFLSTTQRNQYESDEEKETVGLLTPSLDSSPFLGTAVSASSAESLAKATAVADGVHAAFKEVDSDLAAKTKSSKGKRKTPKSSQEKVEKLVHLDDYEDDEDS